jgi:alpha-galactosidase
MRFGLWVEPEMVNQESDLYRAHPDWVCHFRQRSRTVGRNQLVLNLAREDGRDWVCTTLDTLLSQHHIEFIKWDMNRHFSEPGWPAEAERNSQRIWLDHVRSLYWIIDEMRRRHPQVSLALRGLKEEAHYRDAINGTWYSSAFLAHQGLPVSQVGDFDSHMAQLVRA